MSYYLHGSIQFIKALIGQEVQVNRAGSKQHLQPCKTNVLQKLCKKGIDPKANCTSLSVQSQQAK